jgi:hypothetical protein
MPEILTEFLNVSILVEESQVISIYDKIRKIDKHDWKYKCYSWGGKEYHEISAWITGLHNAQNSQITLSNIINSCR